MAQMPGPKSPDKALANSRDVAILFAGLKESLSPLIPTGGSDDFRRCFAAWLKEQRTARPGLGRLD